MTSQAITVDALEDRVFLSASSTVEWTTYVGGSAEDRARAMAVDSAGNVFVAGYTKSSDFDGAVEPKVSLGPEGFDGFLEKLDRSGNVLWARYLYADVQPTAIATDHEGNVWVTGSIAVQSRLLPNSNNMPPAWSDYVDVDVFVAKYSNEGESLWATYLGGSEWESATSIAVDQNGDAFVCGYTPSPDLLGATNKLTTDEMAPMDGFVAKVTAAGAMEWATYVGGSGSDSAVSVTVDETGEIILAGGTRSRDLPKSTNDYCGGNADGFVAGLGRSGELLWTTYIGSDGADSATGVSPDRHGDLYVVGRSYNESIADGPTAFVMRLMRSGVPVWTMSLPLWTTANAVTLDSAGSILFTGESDSPAPDKPYHDLSDSYVASVDPSGILDWLLPIDGDGSDSAGAIAVGSEDTIFVAGTTSSTDYLPSASNSFHGTLGSDGFVTAISVPDVTGSNTADEIHLSSAALELNGELVVGTQVAINGIAGEPFIPTAPIEIYGINGNDTIIIDPDVAFPVIIHGGPGNDTITGGSGDDLLYGDDGNDLITGGGGNDTLYGNFGSDTLSGGSGDDLLFAGLGPDLLNGGEGDDTLVGGNGMDQIRGGAGADNLNGKGKADTLSGGIGNDTLTSGAGSDLIAGQDGDDTLYANPNLLFRDTLIGGAGRDVYSAAPNDVLQEVEEELLA